jgi:hypothetical protein
MSIKKMYLLKMFVISNSVFSVHERSKIDKSKTKNYHTQMAGKGSGKSGLFKGSSGSSNPKPGGKNRKSTSQ